MIVDSKGQTFQSIRLGSNLTYQSPVLVIGIIETERGSTRLLVVVLPVVTRSLHHY
jgi:hypothetical protein